MNVTRFEDLECWKAARALVKEVFLSCMEGRLSQDFETRGQFKRAALGSMNNIAEGFGRFGTKDKIRFLDFSKSSTLEVQSMLYALEDVEYLSPEKIQSIRKKADDAKNLTLGFIRYLRNQKPPKR